MRTVKVGQKYRHFKGREYVIIATGVLDCDTLEPCVVYADFKGQKAWVRKEKEFLSFVDKKKYPKAKQKFRFELISDGRGKNGHMYR